jgi:signal transduction histidine kinase/ABC-type nitrate/sulfonate/bicarbonate transport system substrate-binding protein
MFFSAARAFKFLGLLVWLCLSSNVLAAPLEHVSLQLLWKHQFEFAGFYAAIAKGFYQERGLEVSLREYTQGMEITEEVVSGRATYGLYNSNLILQRLQGQPLVLLGNYFKRLPLVLLTHPDITRLEDLRGKRLMIDNKDIRAPLLTLAFESVGLKPGESFTTLPHSFDAGPFLRGEVDAMSAFLSNEPYFIEAQGIAFNMIELGTYLPALGDVYLFSSEQELELHPHRAKAFLDASNEGWAYALAHPEEIIDIIINQYSTRKSREALRYEAEKTHDLMLPLSFPIGSEFDRRIYWIANTLLENGAVENLDYLPGFLADQHQNLRHAPELILTADERRWLAAHPRIRVGFDPAWAPVEFLDNTGQPQGISIDYLKRLESLLQVQFEFVSGLSWGETLNQVKQGGIDLLPALAQTPAREEWFAFTPVYLDMAINIFSNADVAYLGDLNALHGERVAVVRDYALHDWLRQDYPDLDLFLVNNIKEGLHAVASGAAFAFIDNLINTSYYIGETGLTQIKVAGETSYRFQLRMAARKDWPELATIMHKALSTLPPAERHAIYQQWITVKYQHSVDYRQLWQVTIVVLVFVLIMVYWNRRLRREVVRRRDTELKLEQARYAAERANQAKSAFLMHMSHELRTPLNAILGYARIIQKRPEQSKEGARIIAQSGEHLYALITDLLDLAKIEAGRLELNIQPTFLPGLLRDIIALMRTRAADKQLSLTLEMDAALPMGVFTDEKRLRQVLLNLLNNAIKFTLRGGVLLRVQNKNGTLHFRVEDSGIGIAPAHLEKIFQPFEQIQEASAPHEGTGLGLDISRQLVRMMGAELEVQSTPGQGSCFYFSLALKPAAVNAKESRAIATVRAYHGARRHLLIVDDKPNNRTLLRAWLSHADFRVSEASSGAEALRAVAQQVPDLILMDLMMPELDGFETTRQIRARPGLANLPIIAVSAFYQEDAATHDLFQGFIEKPIKQQKLWEMLAAHLPLEWIYQHSQDAPTVLPPPDKLQELYDLALLGKIPRIREWAAHLPEEYAVFAAQVLRLAQDFDDEALLRLATQAQDHV